MREAIEPQLDQYSSSESEYLNSYESHVAEMRTIIDGFGADETEIKLSPKVLGDIGCHLVIRGKNGPDTTEIEMYVIPNGKDNYNGVLPGIGLTFGKKDGRINGTVDNRTNQTGETDMPPLRNISGILAPYEDAFCQVMANKTPDKEIKRVVSTEKGFKSRLVKNYLTRGYSQRPESNEQFQSLYKVFKPSQSVNLAK